MKKPGAFCTFYRLYVEALQRIQKKVSVKYPQFSLTFYSNMLR